MAGDRTERDRLAPFFLLRVDVAQGEAAVVASCAGEVRGHHHAGEGEALEHDRLLGGVDLGSDHRMGGGDLDRETSVDQLLCGGRSRGTALVVEDGGFLYDSDAYNDDLPYWLTFGKKGHLVIPYTLDNNDMRYGLSNGFSSGDDFYAYLRDAFDVLYREGETAPKMMSIGLHMRLAGRPGRMAALLRFLDYVQRHDKVWICRRRDIAEHWRRVHPYRV